MKHVRLALLIFLSLAAACGGGGSGTVEPPIDNDLPPLTVVSGTFAMTSTRITNGCDITTTWDGPYDIEIDSTSFSMGPWTGTWNASKRTAVAESVHDITQTRNCRVSRYTTIYITFKDADTFKGNLIYRVSLGGDCGDRAPCSTSWVIAGTRVDSLAAGP